MLILFKNKGTKLFLYPKENDIYTNHIVDMVCVDKSTITRER